MGTYLDYYYYMNFSFLTRSFPSSMVRTGTILCTLPMTRINVFLFKKKRQESGEVLYMSMCCVQFQYMQCNSTFSLYFSYLHPVVHQLENIPLHNYYHHSFWYSSNLHIAFVGGCVVCMCGDVYTCASFV